MRHDCETLVAPLFEPANRPDRFVKAAASGADAVILDLEDAVPADAKEGARQAIHRVALAKPVIVRINGVGTPWHELDCAALTGLKVAAIMLPKTERAADLARVAAIAPVIGLIETARGLAEARAIARSGLVARLAFGSVDYAVDVGCEHCREALACARAEIVLASRLGGLPSPLDGVTTDIDSVKAVRNDARAARRVGFGGKLLIHPSQVSAVLEQFRPDAAAIAWARRVVASGEGAVRLDGAMVDAPVRARARAILTSAASRDVVFGGDGPDHGCDAI